MDTLTDTLTYCKFRLHITWGEVPFNYPILDTDPVASSSISTPNPAKDWSVMIIPWLAYAFLDHTKALETLSSCRVFLRFPTNLHRSTFGVSCVACSSNSVVLVPLISNSLEKHVLQYTLHSGRPIFQSGIRTRFEFDHCSQEHPRCYHTALSVGIIGVVHFWDPYRLTEPLEHYT